jgi:urea carboxylase
VSLLIERPRLTTTVEVVAPGTQTTVQDLPGRSGLWGVGVPPSGAWDDLSFSLANLSVGNDTGAAGLEAVLQGPVLRFAARTLVCLTGAVPAATLDGRPVRLGVVTPVPAGGLLDVGPLAAPGMRAYVAVAGGLDVPVDLGSRSTFLLGGFGGHAGRALRAGDVLSVRRSENAAAPVDVAGCLPELRTGWQVRVVPGPHGAPDHLTAAGVEELLAAEWQVDHRADRTGVRLLGPPPQFSRPDGGDAGMHPSNLHDSAYPVGGVMLSGGTPVVVGPDGPSLGGFVVPAVVVQADRWVLAQARPGDRLRLVPVTPEEADAANAARRRELAQVRSAPQARAGAVLVGSAPPLSRDASAAAASSAGSAASRPDVLLRVPPIGSAPELTVRRAGDCHVLVEAGEPRLDLAVRLQVHLLAGALAARQLPEVRESVEGVRSLLLRVDEDRLPLARLAEHVGEAWTGLPDPETVRLPVREVTLPIALDDPSVHEAMQRYQRGVRPDAPWCPDNVEFIRRVNGLGSRDEVFDVVTAATYLVVGLGDVYLGAPVAVPLDPRHRLVTTKYDPARTWTPQNAVGIGGIYLCVYGMEGPGGYQLVGRTVPVWRHSGQSTEPPWLLRVFDRLRFRPVSSQELADLRADIAAGRRDLDTTPATIGVADFGRVQDALDGEAATFTARRQAAFAEELARWSA